MNIPQRLNWFFQGSTPDAMRARRTIKILLLLALFVGLFWIVPVKDVLSALASTNLEYLAIGLFFVLISFSLTAVEMMPLIRQQGIMHSISKVFAINLAAKFYSLFAPGTIVAGGIKWYRLAQPGGKTAEAFAALGFFRLLETFLSLTIGLSFWLLSEQNVVQVSVGWIGILLAGIVVFWFVITRLSLPIFNWFDSHTSKFKEHPYWCRAIRIMKKLVIAVSCYADIPAWSLFLAVFFGLVSHLVGIMANLYLAKSVGIQLSFLDLGWIQSVVEIATQMPFAIAGGIGIREVTLVAIMPTLGIGADIALAFSLLLFVKGVLLSILGGLIEVGQTLRLKRKA